MKFATSAIVSTDAIASDATTQVEPHSSANWMIDFVSSSMKPAPSRKNCHDQPPPWPRVRQQHGDRRHDQHQRQRDEVVPRHVPIAQVEERPVVGGRLDRRVAHVDPRRARLVRLVVRGDAVRARADRSSASPGAARPASRRGRRAPRARARAAPARTPRAAVLASRSTSHLLAEVVVDHQQAVAATGDPAPPGTIPR